MTFAAAGLPLLRVPIQPAYDTRALTVSIQEHLRLAGQGAEDVPPPDQNAADAGPPPCPNCGQPMVLRVARRGTYQGESFWGCPDYPRCRGMRAYERMSEG